MGSSCRAHEVTAVRTKLETSSFFRLQNKFRTAFEEEMKQKQKRKRLLFNTTTCALSLHT